MQTRNASRAEQISQQADDGIDVTTYQTLGD